MFLIFLVAKFRSPGFRDSPRTSVLPRVESENLSNNLQQLGNGARYDVAII